MTRIFHKIRAIRTQFQSIDEVKTKLHQRRIQFEINSFTCALLVKVYSVRKVHVLAARRGWRVCKKTAFDVFLNMWSFSVVFSCRLKKRYIVLKTLFFKVSVLKCQNHVKKAWFLKKHDFYKTFKSIFASLWSKMTNSNIFYIC